MNPKCCWQGELPGYALDFHHVDSGDKNFNLACPPGFNKLRIAEEINKCVILCAVCHRMHTHGDLDVSNLTRCCIEEGEQNGR